MSKEFAEAAAQSAIVTANRMILTSLLDAQRISGGVINAICLQLQNCQTQDELFAFLDALEARAKVFALPKGVDDEFVTAAKDAIDRWESPPVTGLGDDEAIDSFADRMEELRNALDPFLCPHKNLAHECNECMIESDFAYDASRT